MLGTVGIYLSQEYVSEELSSLSFRNLDQVRDTFELILNETDSFALSLATDPGFNQTSRYLLERGIQTLEDAKQYRTFMDSLLTAMNVRRYLYSLYVFNKYVPSKLITNKEGIVEVEKFYDTEWISVLENKKEEMRFWLNRRSIPIFPSLKLSQPVLTLFRNILEPYTLESQGLIVVNIRMEYLVTILRTISNQKGQLFSVVHPSLGTLVHTSTEDDPAKIVLPALTHRTDVRDIFSIEAGGKPFMASYLVSNKYPLLYLSLVPRDTFYQLSYTLLKLTMIFSFGALLLGLGTVIYFTRRSFRNIEYMLDTIEAAEKGLPIQTPIEKGKEDSFYALTHEIVRTFIERNYLKVREQALEFQALQSQINPHFLFNTLTSISLRALSYTGGPNDVTYMVDRLSRILDYSLDSSQREVRLMDEVRFTRYYLEILSLRYPNRFQVHWDIDKELLGCKVIKLLLQPFLENSIHHGIGPNIKQKLHIRIEGKREGEFLRLKVMDDGVGMTRDRVFELLQRIKDGSIDSEHVGLANTIRRVQLMFGQGVEFHLESSPEQGTIIDLKIPVGDGFGFPYEESWAGNQNNT
ncbi:MAG: histidine kinase [Spirochaetes bacterium]|nr:histidine kinase [Spirochaetota bacterium]